MTSSSVYSPGQTRGSKIPTIPEADPVACPSAQASGAMSRSLAGESDLRPRFFLRKPTAADHDRPRADVWSELERRLICAARANPPSDRVPYAFEKRILARLPERPRPEASAFWARALWRAAAPCIVIVLLLGAWSFLSPSGSNLDLSQQFESTMLAAVDQEALN